MRIPRAVFTVALFLPSSAAAQNLSQIVPSLLTEDTFINDTTNVNHRTHFFEAGLDQRSVPRVINDAIAGQLPTFPIGSSSGSMTYSFDPAIGSFTRLSESFGPSFAERPLTIGRRKFSFGFNFQHSSYKTFEGQDLESGAMKFYMTHNNCCPANNPGEYLEPPFEGDLLETALSLDLKTDMFSLFGNYGLTDRLDLGVAIPIVRVDMSATLTSTLLRLATAGTTLHIFPEEVIRRYPGSDANRLLRTAGGSYSGIGDVVVRTKVNLGRTARGAGAVALDLRLPTGDEENLAGTGEAQAKLYGIASTNVGRLSPHVNAGYAFSGGDLADEVAYTAGFDASVTPHFSVAFDVLGRLFRDLGRFEMQTLPFRFRTQPMAMLQNASFEQLVFEEGRSLHTALGAVGAKVNVGATLLVTVNVLFPLTDNGLKPGVTPVIGFDYAF